MTFSISGLGPLPFDPATQGQIPGLDDLGVPFHDLLDSKPANETAPREARSHDDKPATPADERGARADDADEARSERGAGRDHDDETRAADRDEDHDVERGDRDRDRDGEREARAHDDDEPARPDDDSDSTADAKAGDGEDDTAAAGETEEAAAAGEPESDRAGVDAAAQGERQVQAAAGQNPDLAQVGQPQDASQSNAGDDAGINQQTVPTQAVDGGAHTATGGNVMAELTAEQMALLAEFGVGPAGMAVPGEILPELARLAKDGEPGIDLSQALARLQGRNNAGGNGQSNTGGQGPGGNAGKPATASLQGGQTPSPTVADNAANRPATDPQLHALPTASTRVMPTPGQPAQTQSVNVPVVDAGTAGQSSSGAPQSSDPLATSKTSSPSSTAANARPQALSTTAGIQVAIQLSRAIQDGFDRLSVRLNPPELGRVDIKLEVAHDGRALAVISADRQDTLELLQRDSRGLERALQEAGLRADSGSLSFNLRQQGGDGEQQAGGNGKSGPLGGPDGDEDDASALPHVASDRVLDISV